MPDALNYRLGPHPGCPFMCLLCLTAEKDPRQGSLLSAWMGRTSGKDWSRRPFDCQLQETPIKTDRAITSASEEVSVPGHLVPRGSLQAKQLCHLHTQLSLEQNCHRGKKSCIYVWRVALVVSDSLWPCGQWPAKLLCWGISRQEYWSVLAYTACLTLLEHCISCCLSSRPYWVPGAARTSLTQAATPPLHLALTSADPSPPGQPQEEAPVDSRHTEMAMKPQLQPRGSVAKEEDPKPSHQLYKLQIKLSRLCVSGMYKRPLRAPTRENALVLIAVVIEGKNTEG